VKTVQAIINNPVGLHARPAAQFTQLAAKYKAKITLQKDETVVDAKSILKILTLGIKQGTSIQITAEGPDEQEAIDALTKLIEANFGE
jgi:Phosphotransferase System HPr (HPr) Family